MNDLQQRDLDKLGVTYNAQLNQFERDGEYVGKPILDTCMGVTVLDWKATVRALEMRVRGYCTIYPFIEAPKSKRRRRA